MRGGRTRVSRRVSENPRFPLADVFRGGTESYVSVAGVFYKVHTFTSSSELISNATVQSLSVEYLVVAGGGGGASLFGGGGGGGFRTGTRTVSSTETISVTVGAGGAQSTASSANPHNGGTGSNSVFGTITSACGGQMACDTSVGYRDWETDRKSTRLNSSHRL